MSISRGRVGVKVLSGDIGGTKTRLAVFEARGQALTSLAEETYSSREHASFDEVVQKFLHGRELDCGHACFGVAGPVRGGRVETTNLPWVIDAAIMREDLGLERVSVLNDLEANAWGIPALDDHDFFVLNSGSAHASGNASVISAGTGLGEAGLYWDGIRHRPFASEGGHSNFSPGNELEMALLSFLSDRYGRASWERVLSGPGLVDIHEFLRTYRQSAPPGWLVDEMRMGDPSAAISAAALQERDPVCVEALDLFVHLYGVEAGNHALKIMATGGVYIGGGIAPKILEKLRGPLFMEGFLDKGRMRSLLEAMPVRVILNDRTALYGPALFMADSAEKVEP